MVNPTPMFQVSSLGTNLEIRGRALMRFYTHQSTYQRTLYGRLQASIADRRYLEAQPGAKLLNPIRILITVDARRLRQGEEDRRLLSIRHLQETPPPFPRPRSCHLRYVVDIHFRNGTCSWATR
jgi:hypothetical protein